MMLELSDTDFRNLYNRGATPWEIFLFAYLKAAGADVAEVSVTCEELERDMLLPSSSQTRLLKGLVDKKLAKVVYGSYRGPARRHVKLLPLIRDNRNRNSAEPSTDRKPTTRSKTD